MGRAQTILQLPKTLPSDMSWPDPAGTLARRFQRWHRRLTLVKRLGNLRPRQLVGVSLFGFGFGFTVLLAVLGGAHKPVSQATDAVIVIVITLTQGGATWAFSGLGKADPTHAQQSAARLLLLARRAHAAGVRAQQSFEGYCTETDFHAEIGILSTELSWLEDGLVLSLEDWRVFHAQAVHEAEGTQTYAD